MTTMNNILLISEKTIKENSLVSNNVDGKYIQNAIRSAQDLSILPIIGQKLFNRLCEGIANDNLTELETELISTYIQPVLINAVMSDLVLQLSFKFRNLGAVQTVDTNVIIPSLTDLEYIRNDYSMKCTFYQNRLSDFLESNCAKFSQYPGCDCHSLKANKYAFKNPFVLD